MKFDFDIYSILQRDSHLLLYIADRVE